MGEPDFTFPSTPIQLYQGFYYLMPLREALLLLNTQISRRVSVTCPGFPRASLRYQVIDSHHQGCNKLLVIVDTADQVVGIQLVDENPSEARLAGHTSDFRLYNFIQTKTKGSGLQRIAHNTEQREGILVVQSELIDERNRVREYVKLYLAQPIVDAIGELLE